MRRMRNPTSGQTALIALGAAGVVGLVVWWANRPATAPPGTPIGANPSTVHVNLGGPPVTVAQGSTVIVDTNAFSVMTTNATVMQPVNVPNVFMAATTGTANLVTTTPPSSITITVV